MGQHASDIGQSVVITGDLKASEDLTIAGRVTGTIQLPDHVLTIAPGGHLEADLMANKVIVEGTVTGNITAIERIAIGETAIITGDLRAPSVGMADGATLRGKVDMPSSTDERTQEHSPQPAGVDAA